MIGRNYIKMAFDLISLLGGIENINFVTHCATRLRIDIKDNKLVHKDEINDMESIYGVVDNNGKLDVIPKNNDTKNIFDEIYKHIKGR